MSWKVSVFASLEDHTIVKPVVIGVKAMDKKGCPVDDGTLTLRSGSAEPTGATAMVEIESNSDRVLNQKAKKLSLTVRDEASGTVYDIPTDGEFEVEEVF